jgi:hypothetical protein
MSNTAETLGAVQLWGGGGLESVRVFLDSNSDLVMIILTVAVVVLAALALPRRRRALSYQVLSEAPLVSIRADPEKKISVMYDGKPVTNVFLVHVRVINSGSQEIVVSDYEEPVKLTLNPEALVMAPGIAEASAPELDLEPTVEGPSVVLAPKLLNKREWAVVQVLVANYRPGSLRIGGRIRGISQIKKVTQRSAFVSLLQMTSLLAGGWLGNSLLHDTENLFSFVTIGVMVLGYVAMGIWSLVQSRERRESKRWENPRTSYKPPG